MNTTKKIGTVTSETLENSQEYLKHSWEYYKLKLFMHTAELTTTVVKFSLFGFFALMGLMLSSFALAIYFGRLLQSVWLGYLIVGLLYFLFLVIIYVSRKKIEKKIIQKLSNSVLNNE